MSVRVTSWVWENSPASGTELLILLAFADQADDGGLSWPSIAYIAKKTRLHEDTVNRNLRSLVDRGDVTREARPGRSNLFRIVMTPPQVAGGHLSGGSSAGGSSAGDTPPQAAPPPPRNGSPQNHQEPSVEPSESSPQPLNPPRPDVEELCQLLVDLMKANGNRRKRSITKEWRDEARRLLDLDDVPLDEASNVLQWALHDGFWKANIQSIPKFRDKFDTLRIQRDEARRKLQEQANGNVRNLPAQPPRGGGAWNNRVVLPGPDETGTGAA